MFVKLRHFIFLALVICLCVTCGKDNSPPEPQLVPISTIFKLYHIEAGDSTIAGDGSLDQTIEDKVKVTIKLNADFRNPSGNYNVSIHELSSPDALSKVVTMRPTFPVGSPIISYQPPDQYSNTKIYMKVPRDT